MPTAAVLGATGFIGAACLEALRTEGYHPEGYTVVAVQAPRLVADPSAARPVIEDELRDRLATQLAGADVVVNAAGLARPDSGSAAELFGANALLPVLVAAAAAAAGVRNFVQLSSAAVQGACAVLDDSPRRAPFSPYSASKARGEQWLESTDHAPARTTILRPTSVHGADRATTRALVRFANSSFAVVAGRGEAPTPQVLVANVAHAVALLASHENAPPRVLQPWEGLTTRSLLTTLALGRPPRTVPAKPAQLLVAAGLAAGRHSSVAAGRLRRLELLLFGQAQERSWLESQGYTPVAGRQAWTALANQLAPQQS